MNKTIKFKPNIGTSDLDRKLKQAVDLALKGHNVIFKVEFRGRLMRMKSEALCKLKTCTEKLTSSGIKLNRGEKIEANEASIILQGKLVVKKDKERSNE